MTFCRAIKYNSKSGLGLNSDRTFLNTFEQSPAFLASLWLYALVGDPVSAAQLGWCYVIVRAFYPFAFHIGPPLLFVVTFPNYFVIWYMLYMSYFEISKL